MDRGICVVEASDGRDGQATQLAREREQRGGEVMRRPGEVIGDPGSKAESYLFVFT